MGKGGRNINPCLVMDQPRKTNPDITEKLLTGTVGRKESDQTNKIKLWVKPCLSKLTSSGRPDPEPDD